MAEADIERMLDLATPWCLRVAATLRIPGHIAAGHTGIADLAAAAGCDPDALHAVLGHLVSQGVFTEESPGRFACNQAAEQLAGVPFLDLAGIGGRMARTWGTLLDFVRTGQPAYQQVFGRPFWEDLAAHPAIGAEFDALMGPAGHGVRDFDVELSDGWDAVRTVVDVGGGTGAMLASLLRRHPGARGILVDLPGTVARAGEIIENFGVAERVTVEAQSFFDPLPAGGDLYLLKSVLNDWPDEPTVAILRRCAEAAKTAQASIAVLGGVAADETPRSLGIDMLVAGGKTSTLTQFTELARRAGLDVIAARTQSSGRYVVECRPAPVTKDLTCRRIHKPPVPSASYTARSATCSFRRPTGTVRQRSTRRYSAGRPRRTTRILKRPASSASGSRAVGRPRTPGRCSGSPSPT